MKINPLDFCQIELDVSKADIAETIKLYEKKYPIHELAIGLGFPGFACYTNIRLGEIQASVKSRVVKKDNLGDKIAEIIGTHSSDFSESYSRCKTYGNFVVTLAAAMDGTIGILKSFSTLQNSLINYAGAGLEQASLDYRFKVLSESIDESQEVVKDAIPVIENVYYLLGVEGSEDCSGVEIVNKFLEYARSYVENVDQLKEKDICIDGEWAEVTDLIQPLELKETTLNLLKVENDTMKSIATNWMKAKVPTLMFEYGVLNSIVNKEYRALD